MRGYRCLRVKIVYDQFREKKQNYFIREDELDSDSYTLDQEVTDGEKCSP